MAALFDTIFSVSGYYFTAPPYLCQASTFGDTVYLCQARFYDNPLGRTLTCPVPPETPAPDPLWDPIDPLPLLESQMATHPIHWHATTPYHFTTPLFQCQVHILQHHLPCARTPPFLRHHLPCVRPTFADTIPSVSRPPSLCYKTPFTGSGTPSLCHCIPK